MPHNYLGEVSYFYEGNRYYICITHRDVSVKARIPMHVWDQISKDYTLDYLSKLAKSLQLELNQQCQAKGYLPDGSDIKPSPASGTHVEEGGLRVETLAPTNPHIPISSTKH